MPEEEHVNMVVVPSSTVFEVSPKSVMRTFEGGAARNEFCELWYTELLTLQTARNQRHTFIEQVTPFAATAHAEVYSSTLTYVYICRLIVDCSGQCDYMYVYTKDD